MSGVEASWQLGPTCKSALEQPGDDCIRGAVATVLFMVPFERLETDGWSELSDKAATLLHLGSHSVR
jgi:hypothetical protein